MGRGGGNERFSLGQPYPGGQGSTNRRVFEDRGDGGARPPRPRSRGRLRRGATERASRSLCPWAIGTACSTTGHSSSRSNGHSTRGLGSSSLGGGSRAATPAVSRRRVPPTAQRGRRGGRGDVAAGTPRRSPGSDVHPERGKLRRRNEVRRVRFRATEEAAAETVLNKAVTGCTPLHWWNDDVLLLVGATNMLIASA